MGFIQKRSPSLSMVVLVLFIIVLLQGSVSYTVSYGPLDNLVPKLSHNVIPTLWLIFRAILLLIALILWFVNYQQQLFNVIILTNSVLTFGLLFNMAALVLVLAGIQYQNVKALLADVVLLAISNILIFSIWYWIIDPPGVDGKVRDDEPWDFLFPQRAQTLPHYENWIPRYTDYIFLAFTSSFAFSPTDTMPLTRRAKLFMLLQAAISIVTLTAIASSAINILAGKS